MSGYEIKHVEETGSTQDDVRAWFMQEGRIGVAVLANFQKASYGSTDPKTHNRRAWQSYIGNLLLSFTAAVQDPNPSELVYVAAMTMADVIRHLLPEDVYLYHSRPCSPHIQIDDLRHPGKIGGVLVEKASDNAVIVGPGINLVHTEYTWNPNKSFSPTSVEGINRLRATTVTIPSTMELAKMFMAQFDKNVEFYQEHKFYGVLRRMNMLPENGLTVSIFDDVLGSPSVVTGEFEGIEHRPGDYDLVVRSPEGKKKIGADNAIFIPPDVNRNEFIEYLTHANLTAHAEVQKLGLS